MKDGRQYNVDAETIVLRRPDLTVEGIEVTDDIVRTRAFDVKVAVAEEGGDVGASARLLLFDGASTTPIADSPVEVAAAGSSEVTLRIALAQPREHTLRAVLTEPSVAEWD